MRHSPSVPLKTSVALFAALACLAIPAGAGAAPLSLDQARVQAAQATAPLAVEGVVCVRQPNTRGRRAACIVGHPSADGSICRSFVVVKAPRGPLTAARPIRTRVLGLNLCLSRAASIDAGR